MQHDRFQKQYGEWALVTGASSGIGEQFAHQLAAKGLNIALTARRVARLTRLANLLRETYKIQTRVIPVDLRHDTFAETLQTQTADIAIGLVVNNAGLTITAPLLDSNIDKQVDLLNVNARAPLVLSHHFGRRMRERERGGIILVSSITAFTATPDWANYAASKAYLLQLGEALNQELKESGVDVLTVCPGLTKTEFLSSADIDHTEFGMEPADVVRQAIGRLGDQAVIIPGFSNRLLTFGTRFMPRRVNTLISDRILNYLQGQGDQ